MADKGEGKNYQPIKERLASRKFIWANALEIIWMWAFWNGSLTAPEFIELTKLTVGGYLVANVGEHFSNR